VLTTLVSFSALASYYSMYTHPRSRSFIANPHESRVAWRGKRRWEGSVFDDGDDSKHDLEMNVFCTPGPMIEMAGKQGGPACGFGYTGLTRRNGWGVKGGASSFPGVIQRTGHGRVVLVVQLLAPEPRHFSPGAERRAFSRGSGNQPVCACYELVIAPDAQCCRWFLVVCPSLGWAGRAVKGVVNVHVTHAKVARGSRGFAARVHVLRLTEKVMAWRRPCGVCHYICFGLTDGKEGLERGGLRREGATVCERGIVG